MEVANFVRPLPTFDYVPTAGGEPSYRHVPVRSHHRSDKVREMACLEKDGRSQDGNRDRSARVDTLQDHRTTPERSVKSTMTSTAFHKLPSLADMRRAFPDRPGRLSYDKCSKSLPPNRGAVSRFSQSTDAKAHTLPHHNGLLLVELKVTSAILRRILIDTESSVDIIT
ncbi:hypothetical protein Cgig2_028800 [Carnegiea gigantea]|uniref:Uncharacterized protein n=1 Tax=Carnegiea gigantea TaxID=171969 RepID=A0A9Q1GM00_9CARY|nr:hypothetical protein Cgig2_028800 [Carnegiea gigantea]